MFFLRRTDELVRICNYFYSECRLELAKFSPFSSCSRKAGHVAVTSDCLKGSGGCITVSEVAGETVKECLKPHGFWNLET